MGPCSYNSMFRKNCMVLTTTGASGGSEKKLVPPRGRYAPASPGMPQPPRVCPSLRGYAPASPGMPQPPRVCPPTYICITRPVPACTSNSGYLPGPSPKARRQRRTPSSLGCPSLPGYALQPTTYLALSFCISFCHYCSQVFLLTS